MAVQFTVKGPVPGRILNSGVPANQLIGEDPNLDHVRSFRVRPDYLTGSVLAEILDGEGTETEIRAAYERDWFDWPANDGAPYEDVDADGFYNPNVDIPRYTWLPIKLYGLSVMILTQTKRNLCMALYQWVLKSR